MSRSLPSTSINDPPLAICDFILRRQPAPAGALADDDEEVEVISAVR
jgi:hypothetical protein